MTDQELKLELLKVAKAQNPHEMGNSPLEMAEIYYHWVNDNVTFGEALDDWTEKAREQGYIIEEENMTPPGYNEQVERLADKLSKERINLPENFKGDIMILEKDWDILKQVQSIIKTAQSEIFSLSLKESHYTEQPHSKMVREVVAENKIYKNAFNKLLEL